MSVNPVRLRKRDRGVRLELPNRSLHRVAGTQPRELEPATGLPCGANAIHGPAGDLRAGFLLLGGGGAGIELDDHLVGNVTSAGG